VGRALSFDVLDMLSGAVNFRGEGGVEGKSKMRDADRLFSSNQRMYSRKSITDVTVSLLLKNEGSMLRKAYQKNKKPHECREAECLAVAAVDVDWSVVAAPCDSMQDDATAPSSGRCLAHLPRRLS
jgi:hypothetical protein